MAPIDVPSVEYAVALALEAGFSGAKKLLTDGRVAVKQKNPAEAGSQVMESIQEKKTYHDQINL